MTVKVRMFKAPRRTNRWNKNQKVWIQYAFANFAHVRYRFRGKGRYVTGSVRLWDGPVNRDLFKTIDVEKEFADRHDLQVVS